MPTSAKYELVPGPMVPVPRRGRRATGRHWRPAQLGGVWDQSGGMALRDTPNNQVLRMVQYIQKLIWWILEVSAAGYSQWIFLSQVPCSLGSGFLFHSWDGGDGIHKINLMKSNSFGSWHGYSQSWIFPLFPSTIGTIRFIFQSWEGGGNGVS